MIYGRRLNADVLSFGKKLGSTYRTFGRKYGSTIKRGISVADPILNGLSMVQPELSPYTQGLKMGLHAVGAMFPDDVAQKKKKPMLEK